MDYSKCTLKGLVNILKSRDEQIEVLKKRIKNQTEEIGKLLSKRNMCDIDKRYLEVKIVDSSSSKLTINPCSGRVTLKVSNRSSVKVKNDMKKLAEFVMRDKFVSFTHRGRIKYHIDDDKYSVKLFSENGKYSRYFECSPI